MIFIEVLKIEEVVIYYVVWLNIWLWIIRIEICVVMFKMDDVNLVVRWLMIKMFVVVCILIFFVKVEINILFFKVVKMKNKRIIV